MLNQKFGVQGLVVGGLIGSLFDFDIRENLRIINIIIKLYSRKLFGGLKF